MMKGIVSSVTIVCLLFTVTGCASIVSGRSQNISVISIPSGAIVSIDGQKQMSPANFILDKRRDYVVKVEKEGYQPVEIPLKKGVSGWVFGNILFGIIPIVAIIGVISDIASGAASKFTPAKIEVDLTKQQVR